MSKYIPSSMLCKHTNIRANDSKKNKYVGTPTYQRISFLSQQHSHCLAPASAPLQKQPFSGAPANGPFCLNERKSLRKPRLPHLPTNQWQSRLASRNPDKRGQSKQWAFIQRSCQVPSTSRQERRNYTRLPGHDASWTGHYIAQQNTRPDCPVTMPRWPGTTRLGTVRCLTPCSSTTTTTTTMHPVFVFARCRPDNSPPHDNTAPRQQPTSSLGKAP
jgi:hypothetical protein